MKIITALEAQLGEAAVLHGEKLQSRYHHIWKMDQPLKSRGSGASKNYSGSGCRCSTFATKWGKKL